MFRFVCPLLFLFGASAALADDFKLDDGDSDCGRDLVIISGADGDVRIGKEGSADVPVSDRFVAWKCQQQDDVDVDVIECPVETNVLIAHRQKADNDQWLWTCVKRQ